MATLALMGALAHRLPATLRESGLSIAAAGMLSAAVVGVALAVQVPVGLGVLLGLGYALIVLTNLQLGLALWVPLIFLEGIGPLNLAGKAAGLLVAAAWFGSFQSVRETAMATLGRHKFLFAALAGVLAWLSLSLAWSQDPGLGAEDLWHWYILAFLLVVIVTTVNSERALRLVLGAFIVGGVIGVGIGIADGSLTGSVEGGARTSGGTGDPNFLAASLVAATVLAAAMLSDARSPLLRGLLLAAMVLLVTGLVTSESRGGALAAGVAIVAAFALFKRQRVYVAGIAAVAVGVAALTFANAPGTWDRVTDFNDDNGRSDLWTVAWRMGEDYPVLGVGLNNYLVQSPDYVREPGALDSVDLIVEEPHFVHNTYLQLFAENGIVGLVLFLGLVGACLRAAKLAADRFEAQGERSLGMLARAVMVAMVSMLAAAVFLSAGTDKRLWLLLALGPALLAVAGQRGRARRPVGGAGALARGTPRT